jgi:hypothetical protein
MNTSLKRLLRHLLPEILLQAATKGRSVLRNWRTISASTSSVFTDIYRKRSWGGKSASGHGSDASQTKSVRAHLPGLLQTYSVGKLLDVPCGDFHWMHLINLGEIAYIGGDIVPELIEQNNSKYQSHYRQFCVVDLMRDQLPQADLLLCRDCLIHLSFSDVKSALRNFARSGIPYLLTTNYPQLKVNTDIVTGDFRAINFRRSPFRFPKPIAIIAEDVFPELRNNPNFIRELALWRTQDLSDKV